jgi:ribosomal-protein-serine acetyltransferase
MFSWQVDEDIRLNLVNEKFAFRYAALCSADHEYLAEWLEWPRHCSRKEDFLAFIRTSLHQYADGKGLTCAMEYKGEIVGNIAFNKIDHTLKKVEIGYWLASAYRGNGIVTRSCRYLIDYAFSELQMQKVQIAAAAENRDSRAVCERLGMTLEGVLTNQEKVGDRILDHAIYGLYNK